MKPILLNFSGHALSEETTTLLGEEYQKIENVPFQEIDFTSDIEEQIKSILKGIETKLDGSIPIAIIPPGQSTFAILLVVFLHGLLGYFPALCYLEAVSSGYYLPNTTYNIDGHQLRKSGRKFRQKVWNNVIANMSKK